MAIVSHNCPTCSAPLLFDIDTQDWTCDYCKRTFTIEELKKYIKIEEIIPGYDCENCGAEIVTYEDELSTTCAYCGSPVIIRKRMIGEYKPDFIIPFKHNKNDIINALFAHNKSLLPRRFLDIKNVKKISGVYVPYWLFSCDAETTIQGNCYDRKNRKLFIKRRAKMKIDRIPADAKTKLNNEYLNGIEPFKYTHMKEFEYPYLAGFSAEKYDLNSDETFEEQIKKRIFDTTITQMKLEDGFFYDSNVMEKESLLTNRKVEHVLLPVWCVHMYYMGETYIYYVNDQNLIISGKYPVSFFKSLVICALIFLLFIFAAFLLAIGVITEIVIIFVIIIAIALYRFITAVKDYRIIHQNTSSEEYIKHKSFKFIEYKDVYLDDLKESDKL